MKKFLVVILSFFALSIIGFIIFYNVGLSPVGKSSKDIDFLVESGSNYHAIIKKLKENGLIRNEFCFKLYIKFNKVNNLDAGTYKLNKAMSVSDIVSTFSKGNTYNPEAIVITFKEGKNMRSIANTIAVNTNNSEDDVYNLLNDKEYLNKLINDYWFIDESILNENIYYSLEGYLYPNTYEFQNKEVTVQEIFKRLLDEMGKKLEKYKTDLLSSNYSIHDILTLASIVELEGSFSDDRNGIAGVFFNRLNNGWSLGSDVTTYYASRIDMNERDLYQYEIDDNNYYNTRSSYLSGKLPVGPICNPSIESIKATLYPESHNYFYFVSDKNGKTYFSETYQQHLSTKNDLINSGLWYTYN